MLAMHKIVIRKKLYEKCDTTNVILKLRYKKYCTKLWYEKNGEQMLHGRSLLYRYKGDPKLRNLTNSPCKSTIKNKT